MLVMASLSCKLSFGWISNKLQKSSTSSSIPNALTYVLERPKYSTTRRSTRTSRNFTLVGKWCPSSQNMPSPSRIIRMKSRNSRKSSSPLPSTSSALKAASKASGQTCLFIIWRPFLTSWASNLLEPSTSNETKTKRMSRSCDSVKLRVNAYSISSSYRRLLSLWSMRWFSTTNSSKSMKPLPSVSTSWISAASSSCSLRFNGTTPRSHSKAESSSIERLPLWSRSYFAKNCSRAARFRSWMSVRTCLVRCRNSSKAKRPSSSVSVARRMASTSLRSWGFLGMRPNSVSMRGSSSGPRLPLPSGS
mmetsp:Transcript_23321/g.66385  ORF Transcript_23321/g.66385 Transcript_23321/m.66385 type:complete len:305 (+) Transcript_23321:145-1059(+)